MLKWSAGCRVSMTRPAAFPWAEAGVRSGACSKMLGIQIDSLKHWWALLSLLLLLHL